MKIKSVLGEIERKDIGVCTTHEHVLLDLTAFYTERPVEGIDDPSTQKVEMWNLGILSRDCYALKDNLLLDDEKLAIKERAYFKKAGGRTVVDASLPGIGRDPKALARISSQTGLNIIMGTGFYVGQTHPKSLDDMNEEQIADIMIRELTDGIDGVCAGYIGEIGISEIFDEKERKVLRSAAVASKNTGAAINVHINPWTENGREAVEILLSSGINPKKICISHIDVENREEYIYYLLDKGVYVEFDNFGKEYYIRREVRNSGYGLFVSDEDRVKLIKRLVDEGYEKQLLFSCDVCLKNLLRSYGGYGYDHVLRNILPMLDEVGISQTVIDKIVKENPVKFLFGGEQ
jgi:phosphotriesterase-related protein